MGTILDRTLLIEIWLLNDSFLTYLVLVVCGWMDLMRYKGSLSILCMLAYICMLLWSCEYARLHLSQFHCVLRLLLIFFVEQLKQVMKSQLLFNCIVSLYDLDWSNILVILG